MTTSKGSSHHFNLRCWCQVIPQVLHIRLPFLIILIFFMYSFIILSVFMLSTLPVNKSMKNWLLAAFVHLESYGFSDHLFFQPDRTGKLFMIASKNIFANIIEITDNYYYLRENSCIHIDICNFLFNYKFPFPRFVINTSVYRQECYLSELTIMTITYDDTLIVQYISTLYWLFVCSLFCPWLIWNLKILSGGAVLGFLFFGTNCR